MLFSSSSSAFLFSKSSVPSSSSSGFSSFSSSGISSSVDALSVDWLLSEVASLVLEEDSSLEGAVSSLASPLSKNGMAEAESMGQKIKMDAKNRPSARIIVDTFCLNLFILDIPIEAQKGLYLNYSTHKRNSQE